MNWQTKTYAVMNGNIVENIIVGVEPEVVAANPTHYIEYTLVAPAGINWTYNGKSFTQDTPPH